VGVSAPPGPPRSLVEVPDAGDQLSDDRSPAGRPDLTLDETADLALDETADLSLDRTKASPPPLPPQAPADASSRLRRPAVGSPTTRLRSLAFALTLAVLVAAVPALAYAGVQMIRGSHAGRVVTRVTDPHAPGYEALVEPTPTALIIHKDDQGKAVGLVMLALGGTNGGGSAMFLPLNTEVERRSYGIDRFGGTFAFGGQSTLVAQVSDIVRAGFADVVEVDDAKWAALTAKVAPIRVRNPDRISASGVRFPAGPLALEPKQVGPYLAALNPGESELNRLERQQAFWRSWLEAVARSTDPDVVPGETASGIGRYIRTLARGPVRLEAMAVQPDAKTPDRTLIVPDLPLVRQTVADMVPFPVSPTPGARVTMRVLNGVDGGTIPAALVHKLVAGGASVTAIGNGRRFGQKTTVYEFREAAQRAGALLIMAALGGRGRLRQDPEASDAADVTIILGADLLEPARAAKRPGGNVTGATSTTTGSTTTAKGTIDTGG